MSVEQNKANIRSVMDVLRAHSIAGLMYAAFTLDDANTVVHINMSKEV